MTLPDSYRGCVAEASEAEKFGDGKQMYRTVVMVAVRNVWIGDGLMVQRCKTKTNVLPRQSFTLAGIRTAVVQLKTLLLQSRTVELR